jgi:biofilm PGA synthesis N-glycosyltransferase PgaC
MLIVLSLVLFWLGVYIFNRKHITKKSRPNGFLPKISVLIPAFNEERNIGETLRNVFSSDYPKKKMEVIVIDDGSSDKTAKIASKFPVRLISYRLNKGKIFALNKGIANAKGDVIITLDADTKVEPSSFSILAKHFNKPEVGAVAGVYRAKSNATLKNPFKFLLEKIQSLEYLSFALSRKLQETFDSILVVPGALAAYKKEALIKVGGFDNDTVIEDYDITMKMHKAGYKIKCDKDAVGWINAPSNVRALFRQRMRWSRGGIQVIRKHRDILFTKVGLLTYVWALEIIGIFLQLLVFGFAIGNTLYNVYTLPIGQWLLSLKSWFLNVFVLNITAFDTLLLTSFMLFMIGLVNSSISIRLLEDSFRKLLIYPLFLIYGTVLFFIFLSAFTKELIGTKSVWLKAESL